jgi:protein-S-isoprenylcysteine O-methyltransferase Ste14
MASISNHIIIACWIIFLVWWAVSALRLKAVAERQSWLSSLAHKLVLTAGGLLFWFQKFPPPLNVRLTPHGDFAQAGAAVVCVAGLLVTLWARWTLAGNWSSNVTYKQGHELVRAGPYRFARHPIYTGILLMFLGTAADLGRLSAWLGLLLVGLGFWIKLKHEEALLLRHFPKDYPTYQKQVKALVPFVL